MKKLVPRNLQLSLLQNDPEFPRTVKSMVAEGCEICPELQDAVLQCFSKREILKFIQKMNQQGLWLTPSMLVFWLQNADRKIPEPPKTSKFSLCKDRTEQSQVSPRMALLLDYYNKHEDVPWPASFLTAAVQDPDFAELYNRLGLTRLNEQDCLALVQREDIIDIMIQSRPIYLPFEAELVLAERGYKELLAHVRNYHLLSRQTLDFIIPQLDAPSSDAEKEPQWDDEKVAELLNAIESWDDRRSAIYGNVDNLLRRRNYDLSMAVIWTCHSLTEDQQNELLETPNSKELFKFCMRNRKSLEGDCTARIFDLFNPEEDLGAINYLLVHGTTQEFADKLANLPDNVFEHLNWSTLGSHSDLWALLMKTPAASAICKIRRQEVGYVTDDMLIACLEHPNAPELFTFWWDRHLGASNNLSESVYQALLASPYCDVIKDILGERGFAGLKPEE